MNFCLALLGNAYEKLATRFPKLSPYKHKSTCDDRNQKKDLVPKSLETEEELSKRTREDSKLCVAEEDTHLSVLEKIPQEMLESRMARIHQPTKNAMQSGTQNLDHWELCVDTQERWENPLMGWSASGDPLSNFALKFNTAEEAVAYCKRNGWKWYLERKTSKKFKVKRYGDNFLNKRTRVSTK